MVSAFAYDQHAELLIAAGRALRRHDLAHVHRYPQRYDPLALAYEPINLWNTRNDDAHLFDRTALPGLYRWLLARRDPALADLVVLLLNEQPGRREQWERLLNAELVQRLIDCGALRPAGAGFVSVLRFIPCFGRVHVSDGPVQTEPPMVYAGKDTLLLLNALRQEFRGRRFGRGLEIGCGTGLLSIALSDYCDATLGVDINPRAVACARINQRINEARNLEIRQSDAFAEAPETFDVIISNPPYVFVPPQERGRSLHAYGGEDYGVDFQLRILAELDRKLTAGGLGLFLCCSPVVQGVDILPDRLRARCRDLPLQFDFRPLFNNSAPELLDFHDSVGIQYTWAYIVTVRRAAPFRVTLQPPTAWTRFVSWAFRSAVRAAHRLGRV